MRNALLPLLLACACSHHSTPELKTTPNASPSWEAQADLYYSKLADAMDASGDDCVKLTESLKALEKDSTQMAKVLVDAGKELKERPIEPTTLARVSKHAALFDKCQTAKTEGFDEALTLTIFTVEPLKGDRKDSAYAAFFAPNK